MLGSSVLEVATGLFFVYFLLSVICSAIKEWISGVMGLRASTLEAGIRRLLDDGTSGLAGKLFQHGMIQGLAQSSGGRPSYIPSSAFATALLHTIAPSQSSGIVASVTSVASAVRNLPASPAKDALLAMTSQAGMNIERLRENIENWFNAAMDRLSGQYKRITQLIIFAVAFLVVAGLNADSYMIANRLIRDSSLRTSLASSATQTAKQGNQQIPGVSDAFKQAELAVPLGWTETDFRHFPTNCGEFAEKVLGLLITMIAVSLGAPFWFDLLNSLVNLRSTGSPPPAKPS